MIDECRMCSCHCRSVAAVLSMTLRLGGRATNDNAAADVHVTYDPDVKMLFLRFDVTRREERDGVVSGTLAIELTDVLLASLADVHAALLLAPHGQKN